MKDIIINDYALNEFCHNLFREIIEEAEADVMGKNPKAIARTMVDACDYVVQGTHAHAICKYCDVTHGLEYLNKLGVAAAVTKDSVEMRIVFGEIYHRVLEQLDWWMSHN